MNRREFIGSMGAAALMPYIRAETKAPDEDAIAVWDRETELVSPQDYGAYLQDGQTRGFTSLEKLEAAFEKVMREVKETVVTGDVPAVWSVYNMGYVVKTRESLFAVDLVHRRDAEFAPMLDFALITHNHGDHWRDGFYRAMDGARKTVISNFQSNSKAVKWKNVGGVRTPFGGGYARGVKTFKIKDVEIRTSLIDHNNYLIDFTTAFEIKIGDFILYHTGDSGRGTERKLGTAWGRPDLWLFFPGCGINVAKAVPQVQPKRIVFGHLWELGHVTGRLTTPMVRRALANAAPACANVSAALWGDRVL